MNPSTLPDFATLKFLLRPPPIGVTGTAMENVESLGSWLHRLGQENALHAPLRLAIGKRCRTSTRVESHLTNSTDLTDLARATGRTTDELLTMAFFPPPTKVTGKGSFRLASWLLRDEPGSTPHVVCPTCVGEDLLPYWRKSWRLSVIVDCPVHGTPMAEKCGQCNRRFSLYWKAKHPLNCCTWCGAPIQRTTSKAKIKPAPSIWRDFFYSTSYKGRPLDIKPVFDDLSAAVRLLNLLLSYAQAAEIGNHWFHRHAGPPLAPSSRSEAIFFPSATIDERRQVLKFVAAVMTSSEHKYLALPPAHHITHRMLEILSFTSPVRPAKSGFGERRIA